MNADGTCVKCHANCETYDQSQICLTCKTDNSSPGHLIGCVCNSGYYNVSELTETNSCIFAGVSSIELKSNTSTPSANFNFIITVFLKNENGENYGLNADVEVWSDSSNLFSESSLVKSNSDGFLQFVVFSSAFGANKFLLAVDLF